MRIVKALGLLSLAVISLAIAACGQAPAPGYSLQWYNEAGTDAAELTPGFQTLEMCRRAGSGKTWSSYNEQTRVAFMTGEGADDRGTWFECLKDCRTHKPGSYLLVCKEVHEFRGSEARTPFL